MKNKYATILSAVLLMVLASISCGTLAPATEPMPPDDFFGPTGGPLKIDPDSLSDAQVGVSYEAEIRISQNITPAGDIFVSDGALPAGLTLTMVEGEDAAVIAGTPTEAGEFTFTISVWCFGTNVTGQVGEKEYTILVE